jgi:hypothetical protein
MPPTDDLQVPHAPDARPNQCLYETILYGSKHRLQLEIVRRRLTGQDPDRPSVGRRRPGPTEARSRQFNHITEKSDASLARTALVR